nr:copper homeostasis membrane protein CopD [Rhizobium sp. SG741]
MTPESAVTCLRFLHDGALCLLWGGLGFACFLAGRTLVTPLVRLLETAVSVAVGVVVATSVSALPVQTADITGHWASVYDVSTLHLVAETAVGEALALQVATAIMLLLANLLRAYRTSVLIAGLMLCELALSGHAAEDSGLGGVAHQAVDAVHVLSGCAWLGGLIPFMLILRMAAISELRSVSIKAMRRFSTAGHVAVGLVLISGIVNLWFTVGRLPIHFSSPYDQKLCLKILAVGLMTAIAIVNRYAFVPMIRRDGSFARSLLACGCAAELVLGAAALGLVASFGLKDPA